MPCFSLSQSKQDTVNLFRKQFKSAVAFSVGPSGNFYIIDGGTNEIFKYSHDGAFEVKTGGSGWTDGTFDHPSDIISPNSLDVYVADYGNHRIQRFDKNLNFVSTLNASNENESTRLFGYPRGIAVDYTGALYIIDGENDRIVKMIGTSVKQVFGGVEAGEGMLHHPQSLVVSNDDNVFILDDSGVVQFSVYGNYLKKYKRSSFSNLQGIALLDDNLIVTDSCYPVALISLDYESLMLGTPGVLLKMPCDAVDTGFYLNKYYILTKNQFYQFPYYWDKKRSK